MRLKVLRERLDIAGQNLAAADADFGKVRAAIRAAGLKGVRFGYTDGAGPENPRICCDTILED